MLKNYLKIIIRNIKRSKWYSLLNVSGLAIGIAVTALIMLYVQYEWEYDRFFPNSDRIYRVIQRQPGNVFMGTDYFAVTPEPLGMAMKSEFPEIDKEVTLSGWNDVITVGDKNHFDEHVLYAIAPNFFEIFSYHFIEGDPNTALSQLNTVVLSEDVAKKFFGSESPVGKTINAGSKKIWTVTGVFHSMPVNSQFSKYGMIISFNTYKTSVDKDMFQWGNSSWYTYLLLKKGIDPEKLQAKFPSVVNKYFTGSRRAENPRQYFLQRLTDIHLFNKANFELGEGGDIKIVLVLIALAFVILAIACINYTNLSTARASLRAREVGVRKVVGAKKSQLVAQFIGESIMLSISAGLLSLVLVELFLPSFFQLTGADIGNKSLLQPSFIISFLMIIIIVGLLSGAYPAFVLSKFQPARVLKGDKVKGDRPSLRRVLVVIQFTASIALIACTLVILSQMNFIRTKDMGYNRNNVLVLPLNDGSVIDHLNVMKQELSQYSSIVSVTTCSHLPINVTSETVVELPGKAGKSEVPSYQLYTDYDFLKTFNIPIVEGRNFSSKISTDSSSAIIINQSLEKALGWNHSVGKILNINDSKYNVVGVMKDFNLHSVRHKIQPLFIGLFNPWNQYLCIRIQSKDIPSKIAHIKSVWNHFANQRSFKYTFLDADFNAMYNAEERLSKIVSYSSGLAILIACLGLLGLVSFIVEQRRKEIGIRKVLGASITDVVQMLSMQFLQLVIIANIIAWPAAYYLMHEWLNGFVYKINLQLWPFIIAGAAALLIVIATVSSLALKAANTNPSNTLRYE